MKIIIIGAGLAGLSAATRLAQLHHKVIVLEKRPTLSPRGGSLSTRPGASRVLMSWGLEADMDVISNRTEGIVMRDLRTGEIKSPPLVPDAAGGEGIAKLKAGGKGEGGGDKAPHWGTTREELIRLFYDRALEYGAEVRFGSGVERVEDDEHGARVVLSDGTVLSADLVLVADGIKSRLRDQILADLAATSERETAVEVVVSDITGYGFKLDTAGLDEAALEEISRLTENVSSNIWIGGRDAGAESKCFAVTRYSARSGNVAVLAHTIDPRNTNQTSLWDDKGDLGYVREAFNGSCSSLTAALRLVDSCDRWRLADFPILPRWSSRFGRLALLGDSAHAMHPSVGQGFSQIVEDIGVLSELLRREEVKAGETGKSLEGEVPKIIEIWQEVRKPRVDIIWEYSRWSTNQIVRQVSGGSALGDSGELELDNEKVRRGEKFKSPEFLAWSLGYDVNKEIDMYYATHIK